MGLLKLILKDYKENWFRSIVLFLISVCITVTGLLWYVQADLIYGSVRIFDSYGLENRVYIDCGSSITKDDLTNLIKSINSLDSVSEVKECYYPDNYNMLIQEDTNYSFELFKLPKEAVSNNPYKMVSGRVPKNANEIMISSNIKGIRCGDILSNCRFNNSLSNNGGSFERTAQNVTVTGIFDLNNLVPFNNEISFQGRHKTEIGTVDETKSLYGYAFYVSITDMKGDEIPQFWDTRALVVTPTAGISTKTVVNDIGGKIGLYGVYDSAEYKEHIEEYHAEDLMLYRTLAVAFATVLVTINISYCFIHLSIKKNEMAIYYACGFPWKKCISSIAFMYLPFVLAGIITGTAIFASKTKLIMEICNGNYLFSLNEALLIALLITSVYVLVNLFFYVFTSRKTPMDLLTRKDV